ncbi:MAG: hypothetical protein HKN20_14225, partial [Gemmatimonadetes bacterium]|nr:hypothetical protein [Gemmatimonadota bacterium]
MNRSIKFAVLLAGSLAIGCAGPRSEPASLLTASALELTLDDLRAKSESIRSFHIEGTLLLEWETQKHFVHYVSYYEHPDRFRIDCTVGGPLGLGSGTLHYVEKDGWGEITLPDEPPVSGPVGGKELRAVATGGLSLHDARYGLSPYAGGDALFRAERVKAHGIDAASGRYRLTLTRDDGLEEIVLVDPDPVSLAERRVAKRDGTVLAVTRYEYKEAGDLFASETESRFPQQ